MGISPGWFHQVLMEPARNGHVRKGARFLDIGASELFCASNPQAINDFINYFDGEPWPEEELPRVADRAYAKNTFERAGFSYHAVDYANYANIIRLDLNVDRLPWRHRGKYDFVANSGTSEHILNQYNVFKVIHEAAAVGGLMYHGIPFLGTFEHGIIQYTPKLLWALATDNEYDIISQIGVVSGEAIPLREDFVEKLRIARPPIVQETWLHFIFRKKYNRAFRGANDPAFSAEATMPA